jgi:hypothetical protein
MKQHTDTYLALIDAIQAHITAVSGSENYARDWVLVAGVDNILGEDGSEGEIRLERSPRSTPYTVTGLLGWAMDCYQPTDMGE